MILVLTSNTTTRTHQTLTTIIVVTSLVTISARPCGATDNASDYGSEDSRFKSWQGRFFRVFCQYLPSLNNYIPDIPFR